MSVINNSAAISSGAGQWSSMGTGSNPTSMANSSVSFLHHDLRTLENTFHLIINIFQASNLTKKLVKWPNGTFVEQVLRQKWKSLLSNI